MKNKLLLSLLFTTLLNGEISNYKIEKKEYFDKDTLMVITRSFNENNQSYYLTLNSKTFEIKKRDKSEIDKNFILSDLREFYNSKFFKVLTLATQKVKNGGLESELNSNSSIYLTIDMCPSSKTNFEKEFFKETIKLNSINKITPIPISIAITNSWIKKHKKEFEWIMSQKDLNITWINHTYTHFYNKNLPINQNFLLSKDTNLTFEILELEKSLLNYGLTPSTFIRFPGLICDEKIMKELKDKFLLIPISSNAWLAKDEKIKEGSIILVHGNLNEHKGIKILLSEYKKFLKKDINLSILPLNQAFKE